MNKIISLKWSDGEPKLYVNEYVQDNTVYLAKCLKFIVGFGHLMAQ